MDYIRRTMHRSQELLLNRMSGLFRGRLRFVVPIVLYACIIITLLTFASILQPSRRSTLNSKSALSTGEKRIPRESKINTRFRDSNENIPSKITNSEERNHESKFVERGNWNTVVVDRGHKSVENASNTSVEKINQVILNKNKFSSKSATINSRGSKRIRSSDTIKFFVLGWCVLLLVCAIGVVNVIAWLRRIDRVRSRSRVSSEVLSRLGMFLFLNGRLSEREATILRIASTTRDFNSNDYELLQQLDEYHHDESISEGCSNEEINRLPLHTLPMHNNNNNNNHNNSNNRIENQILSDMEAQHNHDSTRKCSVCLGFLEPGDEIRTVPCLHQFHKDCIDPWLRSKAVCPICKFPVST